MINTTRTIVSAVNPVRYQDDFAVWLKVWFEELSEPVLFCAIPFDVEVHGRELWIRAMAGEYGPVDVRPKPDMPVGRFKITRLPGPRLIQMIESKQFCCEPLADDDTNGPIKWR
jgi:hypothetical protein